MLRRLAVAVLLVSMLVAAPAAADGGGPAPPALQGGDGALSPDGTLRYLAIGVGSGDWTSLQAIQPSTGKLVAAADLAGSWGFPTPIGWGTKWSNLSTDGKTLVVTETAPGSQSRFLVYNPKTMQFRVAAVLNGTFTFDALSPDGSRLYLIQQMSQSDLSRYVVRAYDLRRQRLLPGRIADRTQKGWIMQGYPVTRETSSDGRMVYTLYSNPGGYPFVHALDTVRGVAHCVGIPMKSSNAIGNVVLSLHGKKLAVHWRSGRPWYEIDTTTWRIAPARASFPWLWAALGCVAALLAAGAALLRHRRRRQEFDEELTGLLQLPERRVVV
jgi:hypothetical protein